MQQVHSFLHSFLHSSVHPSISSLFTLVIIRICHTVTRPHGSTVHPFLHFLASRRVIGGIQIVSSEVSGSIEANSRLSGVPDMLLIFQDPSVRFDSLGASRVVVFIPLQQSAQGGIRGALDRPGVARRYVLES